MLGFDDDALEQVSGGVKVKAQDSHLKKMVAGGDASHEDALESMQRRWKRPVSGMGWYMKTKKAFAALPED